MEKNIFENAYFGKAYKTRDGRKVIFLDSYEVATFGEVEKCIKCIIQDEPDFYFYEPDGLNFHGGYAADEDGNIEYWNTDIVSEWKTVIDDNNLNEIAYEELGVSKEDMEEFDACLWTSEDYIDAFKAGYRKALNK